MFQHPNPCRAHSASAGIVRIWLSVGSNLSSCVSNSVLVPVCLFALRFSSCASVAVSFSSCVSVAMSFSSCVPACNEF